MRPGLRVLSVPAPHHCLRLPFLVSSVWVHHHTSIEISNTFSTTVRRSSYDHDVANSKAYCNLFCDDAQGRSSGVRNVDIDKTEQRASDAGNVAFISEEMGVPLSRIENIKVKPRNFHKEDEKYKHAIEFREGDPSGRKPRARQPTRPERRPD